MRPVPLTALLLVGFIVGLFAALDAKDIERNRRVKEINANVTRGLDLLERRYLAKAKPMSDFVDLAPQLRQENWGTGSCVHATTVSLLRWANLDQEADEWRSLYSGGEWTAGPPHTAKMDKFGLKYVVTQDGDEQLLDWSIRTRRGCGVAWPRAHCVALVGHAMHDGQDCAIILDNNHTQRYDYVPWSDFVYEWKSLGGQAFAFCYDPPPPTPR